MANQSPPTADEPGSATCAERVYRVRRGWRVFLLILGLVLCGLAVGCCVAAPAGLSWGVAFVCTPLVAIGAWAVRGGIVQRLILRGESLEVHGVFSTRRMRADQAKGRRAQVTNGTEILTIEPLDPETKPLRFELIYETDQQLTAWLTALRDLDARQVQESSRELLEERPAWETAEQRRNNVELARRVARFCNVAAMVTSLWALFFTRPYSLSIAVVASMPWLALLVVANSGGLIRFDAKRNEARPIVAQAFILPSFVLMSRAIFDCHVLDLTRVLTVGAGVAVIVTMAVFIADASSRRIAPMVVALFCSAPYAGGATVFANTLLDTDAYTTFHPQVLAKHASRGKHTTYHLKLEPWGPQREADEVAVPRRTYEGAAIGAHVRVALHPGALSIRWITVQTEPPQTASAR